jgi:hypothetical protein
VQNAFDGDFVDPLGGRIIGEARIVLAISLAVPVVLACLFAFTPVLPEWVSIIYLACALTFLFIAIITIPVSKSASMPRKLFPFLILLSWTISWVVIWGMMNYKLSSSTSSCFTYPLTRIDSFYVAATTLTTLGSGMFSPRSQTCVTNVAVQSGLDWVVTIAFVSIFISRYFGQGRIRSGEANNDS